MPISAIRTKVRQEFERNRFVKNVKAVDVLIFQSNAEFQVRLFPPHKQQEIALGHEEERGERRGDGEKSGGWVG